MPSLSRVLYTTNAAVTGGRSGTGRTDDGRLAVRLAPPRKRDEGATNPEQLFAVGYAACFGSALAEVAAGSGADIDAIEVDCHVSIGTLDGPGEYGLAVEIAAYVPGVDAAEAQRLVELADRTCPYSNAVRGNIDKTLTVRFESRG